MENVISSITTVNYLEDKDVAFIRTEGGFVSLKYKDKEYSRVTLQRAFPLPKPAEYISVREICENREPGEEIGIIKNINDLSGDNFICVEQELNIRYFTPTITKINKLKDERGYIYIEAETTSGDKKIIANNSSSGFVRLSAKRVLIVDTDGNRYDIPDMFALDKKSLHNLEVVV